MSAKMVANEFRTHYLCLINCRRTLE